MEAALRRTEQPESAPSAMDESAERPDMDTLQALSDVRITMQGYQMWRYGIGAW